MWRRPSYRALAQKPFTPIAPVVGYPKDGTRLRDDGAGTELWRAAHGRARRASRRPVFPQVPVRQWVLSLPPRLRYRLAWDRALCRAVVGRTMRAPPRRLPGRRHRTPRARAVPRASQRLRSARGTLCPCGSTRSFRAYLSVRPAAARRARTSPRDRRRPSPARAAASVGGRDHASAVRPCGVAGTARRPHAAAAYQSDSVPWRPGPTCGVAVARRPVPDHRRSQSPDLFFADDPA